ncbi:MAG TPA: acyl carrier protein [Lacunisphaera sp.]|jgi:acyl carrier protein
MTDPSEIEQSIKKYISREFLAGEDPAQLTNSTPLISTGILDSIATLRLVAFLEKTFSIEMAPQETDAEHLDTIEQITQLVKAKNRPAKT